jgi:hypothetical protein
MKMSAWQMKGFITADRLRLSMYVMTINNAFFIFT